MFASLCSSRLTCAKIRSRCHCCIIMFHKVTQLPLRSLLFLNLALLLLAEARPSQFGENSQVNAEPDANSNLLETVSLPNGWKPWQLELLAQRLSEYSQPGPADYGWERALRNPEISKRQSRYRQCYFNPISCFKK